ncbi:hypothetical protein BS78_07G123300 [Paspalum vaginatum]|nr:hypothetical protein BS78_07G123300 [Paspalum vaginatum]
MQGRGRGTRGTSSLAPPLSMHRPWGRSREAPRAPTAATRFPSPWSHASHGGALGRDLEAAAATRFPSPWIRAGHGGAFSRELEAIAASPWLFHFALCLRLVTCQLG